MKSKSAEKNPPVSLKSPLSRRSFLRSTAIGGVGLLILPNSRTAFAYEANSKLNVAVIGIAGRGRANHTAVAKLGENIVALCDVDQNGAARDFKTYPQAKQFKDFRRMFDEMGKGIDAVIVATPDHTHAVAAAAAIQRGQHVYCEKPLTRTVHEARVLRDLARKHKVVTQMGNQGSSSNGLRRAMELAWSGAIGDIREAHIWFPNGNGPMTRPSDQPPVPATLDWGHLRKLQFPETMNMISLAFVPIRFSENRVSGGALGTCGLGRRSIARITQVMLQENGVAGARSAAASSATSVVTPATSCSAR